MTSPRQNKLFLALCGNAVLLGLVLLTMWSRGPVLPAAYGQTMPTPAPVTPGALTVVPAQFSSSTFGCYLLDTDRQTLCVYTFSPGTHDLHMEAARDLQFDRQLKLYNTSPPPSQMQRLADRAAQPPRAFPAPQPRD